MKKVRLTKKRLGQLHMAITMDDVLYERFRRLNEEVERKWQRIAKAERIIQVVEDRGDGIRRMLQVVAVNACPEGTQVVVRR